jgi:protein NDRG1
MREILTHFCVFHVNAPGQEDSAHPLPETFEYPTMDELAEQITDVLNHFSIVRYVGLGVGLGGNVLLRHALKYPERVDSLVLVNTLCTATGWIEWGYQKRNIGQLRQSGVTQVCIV